MKLSLLFRVTGIVVFVQLALGGVVTIYSIGPLSHIIFGIVVFILALATLGMVLRSRPRPKPLLGITAGLVADIVIQGLLGFATLGASGNAAMGNALSWVHFINALAIYGMAIAGTFMAMGLERMPRPAAMPQTGSG